MAVDKNKWVGGVGPHTSALMMVGEAPGVNEVEQGIPFVGKTGKEVDRLIYYVLAMDRDDIYITNMIKHWIDEDKKVEEWEWEMMGEEILGEIEKVGPRVIMTLGAISTRWFLKGNNRDMEVLNGVPHLWVHPHTHTRHIMVPCIHPAAALRNYSILSWVEDAFRVAKAMVEAGERAYEWCWDPAPPTKLISIEEATRKSIVALDTETLEDGSPYIISFTSVVGAASLVMADYRRGVEKVKEAIDGKMVILQNAMFDIPVLRKVGIRIPYFTDTMQMSFLLQTLPLNLKGMAYKLCWMKMREYEEVVGGLPDLSYVEWEEAKQYALEDPDATLRVWGVLNRISREIGYERVEEVLNRDIRVMPMLMSMMERGMKADAQFFRDMEDELALRNIELLGKITKRFPETIQVVPTHKTKKNWGKPKGEFNPGSDPQVAKLLYNVYGLGNGMKVKKSVHGGSVDANHMKRMENKHPIVPLITEYRETATLQNNFCAALPDKIAADGRIHTKISMIRIKHSGRLASSNPNLMAQPTRSEDGRRIRNGFMAEEGYVLLEGDYSQVEMRLMAHLSRDPIMCEAFNKGKDIHTETAMRIFGIKRIEDVDEMKHRYPSKRAGFGIINWISAEGLSRELMDGGAGEWSVDRCEELLASWFGIYRGVKRYMGEVGVEARRTGRVVDMWGRMELIPQVRSAHKYIVEEGLRVAGNQKIQSGAQGIIKEAMGILWERKMEGWIRERVAYPILQIHDSLITEVVKGRVEEVVRGKKECMEGAVKLRVPLIVDFKVGERWGSMRKWKE